MSASSSNHSSNRITEPAQTATVKRGRGRPPKDGRSAAETRQLLIRSGVEVLTAQGFSATGLDQLLKRVGVPKGSFYHFFESKEAYVHAVVEHYGRSFERLLADSFECQQLAPLQRLQRFVNNAAEWMAKHQYQRGCLVGNLGQEVNQLPESLRAPLQQILASWEQQVAQCLEAAGIEQAETLAHVFWIGWEGAVMRARLEQSAEPLHCWHQWFVGSLNP